LTVEPRKTLRSGSLDWSYRVAGTGGEGVLLLPGAIGSGEVYFPLLGHLAGELRLVAIDYPVVPSLDEMLSGLAAILDAEGIERVALVGSSFGGMVAQSFLARFPARTTRVVLAATGPPDPERAARNEKWLARARYVPMPLFRFLMKLLVRKMMKRVERDRELWTRFYLEAVDGWRRERLLSQYRLAIEFDRDVRAPADGPGEMLLLEGSEDAVATKKSRDALKAAYPRARVHTFDGAGHGLSLERPEEWSRAVTLFLRNQPAI
jgi:pimeloyl-ACP methyl ester carboxylesterase